MVITTLTQIDGDVIASYTHSNHKNGAVVVGKAGALMLKNSTGVTMHVVAMNPQFLSPSDISDEIVTKEKEIQLAMMKEDQRMLGNLMKSLQEDYRRKDD